MSRATAQRPCQQITDKCVSCAALLPARGEGFMARCGSDASNGCPGSGGPMPVGIRIYSVIRTSANAVGYNSTPQQSLDVYACMIWALSTLPYFDCSNWPVFVYCVCLFFVYF